MESAYKETMFILNKYNISASKSLGQNFLINDGVIERIVESANISNEDLIIEIGPGLGTLTKKLLEKAKKVIAIELDKRMISKDSGKLTILHYNSNYNETIRR